MPHNTALSAIPAPRTASDPVERWLPVVGWEGLYEVSDLGRVKSLARTTSGGAKVPGRIKVQTPCIGPNGRGVPYLRVGLCRDGSGERINVHALVARAFLGQRPDGQVVRHLDGDHTNNASSNLIYGTYRENGLDTVKHGRNVAANKTHCKRGHPFDATNTYVSKTGHRRCRTCMAWYVTERRKRIRQQAMAASVLP